MPLDMNFPMACRNVGMDVAIILILQEAIILHLITVFSPVRSSDEGITTDLEPSGSLYRTVGERLELICSYRGVTSNISSESLSIERCKDRECSLLTSEPVNSTAIQTSIQSLTLEDAGTYTCTFPPDPDTMSILFLRVGYLPSPPKDIYCFSRNHLDMNCTVTLADRDARSKFGHNVTIDFQTDRSTEWLNCLHFDAQTRSCYWRSPAESNSYGIDFLNDFSVLDRYTVRVTVRNILGSIRAFKTISDSSTIVKISKLYHFNVTSITSYTASLTWKLPEYLLPGLFIIDFEIIYTSRWDQHPRQLWWSTKERMKTELTGLVPYTQYDVSIRGRGRLVTDDRNWSPVERISFRTDKSAPSAAPRYTVGGYLLSRSGFNDTGDNCVLQLYLKQLPMKKRNGNLAELYYLVLIQEDTDHQTITRPLTTLTFRDISCWSDRPYIIAVRACIEEVLCSNERAVIHIPSFDRDTGTDFPHASEVIAEGYGDTSVTVTWLLETQPETYVKNVTVFWCRGTRELNICKNNLSWIILPGDATEAMLNLTHSYYRDWLFAVSFTTHEGVSGGLVFDDCQFLYDNIEHTTEGKRNSQSLLGSVKPSFNLLTRDGDVTSRDVVSFTFRYCDTQFLLRKPDQYEVFYRVTTEETEEGDCTYGAHSLNMTATIRVEEIILPDLDPMLEYSVCMRIRTSAGTSELSDVRWRKPLKLPDTSTSDSALIISIILAIAIILVGLTVLIWCGFNKYKSMDVNVQVPVIDNYSDDDKGLKELQSQSRDKNDVKIDGFGSHLNGNTTLITKGLGKVRRPLLAPSLLAGSKRTSSDSGVVRSSLEGQEENGSKENISTKLNGVRTQTPPKDCDLGMIEFPKHCRSHGSGNNDERETGIDCSGSTSEIAADYQPGDTTNSAMIGVGSYCQWDAIGTMDPRLSSHSPETDNDNTGNSGSSEISEYRQIDRFNLSNTGREIDTSSGQTSSIQDSLVPEHLGTPYVARHDHFDYSLTEQYSPLLPMGNATCFDHTNLGDLTNRRYGNYRRPRDKDDPIIRGVTTSSTETCAFYDSSVPTTNKFDLGIACNSSCNDINEEQIGKIHKKDTSLEDVIDEQSKLLNGRLQSFDHEDSISQKQYVGPNCDNLSTASVDADRQDQLICYLEPDTDKSVTCLEPNSGHTFTCLEQGAYTPFTCLEQDIDP